VITRSPPALRCPRSWHTTGTRRGPARAAPAGKVPAARPRARPQRQEALPSTAARDRRPRRRTRRAQSCGACPTLDTDLEGIRRAGRDAELGEFRRAPGRAPTTHTHTATHTIRLPDADLKRSAVRGSRSARPRRGPRKAGRGQPNLPRRRPRGGQLCLGEGSAAPTARPGRRGHQGARRGQRRGAVGAARKGAAREGAAQGAAREAQGRERKAGSAWQGAAKRRGQNQPRARPKYSRARQATPTQNSRSSDVRDVSDARCRPRRDPQSGTRRRTRGVQTCARTSPRKAHTQSNTHLTTPPTQT
jgi:hypothetical protein